jgi:hypothetical protein
MPELAEQELVKEPTLLAETSSALHCNPLLAKYCIGNASCFYLPTFT